MPLLFAGLALVLTFGFLALLLTAARRRVPVSADGTAVLRHTALLRFFSVAALFAGETAFAIWAALYPPTTDGTRLLLVLGGVALAVVGAVLCWEAFRFKLTVGPGELDFRSPWTGRRVVPWALVESVGFSRANGWFVVRQVGGVSNRVPAVVAGIGTFLEVCEKYLPAEKLRPARHGYRWAGRKLPAGISGK